jgi:SPOR domain
MRGIIVVPWILAAAIAAACSREESGWDRARRDDSVASYESYLERFPAGPHAGQARAALAGLRDAGAWARAERLGTPEAWQRYLGEFPDGRHAGQARQRLIDFIPAGPTPADGRYVVQLGAYSSEAAARADLARSAERHGAVLGGTGLRVVAPRGQPDSIWRLRTDALAEDSARDLCARLRAGGVDCVPLPEDSAGQPPP